MSEFVRRIDTAPHQPEPPRSYIGGSTVGKRCQALLSLSLRGFPDTEIPARLRRILRDGHRIEEQVIQDLRAAGYRVEDVDPETGKQWHISSWGGHIAGNADGLIWPNEHDEKPHLLEVKSMNDAKWKNFVKNGVAKSHPQYYDQVQFYMKYLELDKTFFIAYNKNTSEYHVEIVKADPFAAFALTGLAETVLENGGIGEKVSSDAASFQCRGCFKSNYCHGGEKVEPKCRYCINASPSIAGDWFCAIHEKHATEPCDRFEQYRPKNKKGLL